MCVARFNMYLSAKPLPQHWQLFESFFLNFKPILLYLTPEADMHISFSCQWFRDIFEKHASEKFTWWLKSRLTIMYLD